MPCLTFFFFEYSSAAPPLLPPILQLVFSHGLPPGNARKQLENPKVIISSLLTMRRACQGLWSSGWSLCHACCVLQYFLKNETSCGGSGARRLVPVFILNFCNSTKVRILWITWIGGSCQLVFFQLFSSDLVLGPDFLLFPYNNRSVSEKLCQTASLG